MTITTFDSLMRPYLVSNTKEADRLNEIVARLKAKDKGCWRTEGEIRNHYSRWRK
jgi:hypothetical protein